LTIYYPRRKTVTFDNFPNGITSMGVPVIGSGDIPTGTAYWFVDSNHGSNGNEGTWEMPYATIDHAIGKCTANGGDIIVVKPGHAETLASAGAITADIAGVTIYGLGNDADRPELTFSTSTAASCLVTAANVKILNIVGIAGINALANPFHIQASGFTGDIEWRDDSSTVEAARAVLTTAAADRLSLRLKYRGQPTGDACVNAVRLVGVDGADIEIDAYGLASTGWIEFITTASTNVNINGRMYNQGTTDGSKNVINTGGLSCTWDAVIFDVTAGASYSGGSGAALAQDDVSAVSAALLVPSPDVSTNTYSRDATGNKSDAAVYTPGTTKSNTAYVKGAIDVAEKCVATTAATMTMATDDLFTIAGGPIELVSLVGVFQTVNTGAASTFQIQANATAGGATVMSIASSSTSGAAAGTYLVLPAAAGSAVTAVTAGAHLNLLPSELWTIPVGKIQAIVGGAGTVGTVQWYLRYKPMAPGVTVTAAY
jgi:hypothetical protein